MKHATLSKELDISSATAQVAPDLLKALVILSDTTVARSAIDGEDSKTYWKSKKATDAGTTDETFQQSGKQDSLGVMEILCSFKLVLEGKTGKEIPKSSKLELLEKFFVNNFALSDAEANTSRLLNRGGIADLPFLRTLLVICQNS